LAGAVVMPAPATAQHAGHGAVTPPAAGAANAATAASSPWQSAFDDHERATLAVLGEALVPGSTAAGVPGLLDRLLAVEAPEALRRVRNAIGAFEREARVRHAKPWVALDAAERTAVLEEAAAAAPTVTPVPGWRPGEPVLRLPTAGASAPPTLRDHLDHLRSVVARAYYATEPGLTELGWTGIEFWDALPACTR
jgi:hypothetical protein